MSNKRKELNNKGRRRGKSKESREKDENRVEKRGEETRQLNTSFYIFKENTQNRIYVKERERK